MPLFNFKKQFVDPINAGTKIGTIRRPRKHEPRIGQPMRLQYGPRFKPTLIRMDEVRGVSDIRLDFAKGTVTFSMLWGTAAVEDLHAFAVADGFADWDDLRAFWHDVHPDFWQDAQPTKSFIGTWTRWVPNAVLVERGIITEAGQRERGLLADAS